MLDAGQGSIGMQRSLQGHRTQAARTIPADRLGLHEHDHALRRNAGHLLNPLALPGRKAGVVGTIDIDPEQSDVTGLSIIESRPLPTGKDQTPVRQNARVPIAGEIVG